MKPHACVAQLHERARRGPRASASRCAPRATSSHARRPAPRRHAAPARPPSHARRSDAPPRRPRRRHRRRATPGSDASACATVRRRAVHTDDHPLRALETRREGRRRVLGDELARRHDHDARCRAPHASARTCVESRTVRPREPAQQVPHLHGLHGIEADGRLVEHEDRADRRATPAPGRRAAGSPSTASRSDVPPPSPGRSAR